MIPQNETPVKTKIQNEEIFHVSYFTYKQMQLDQNENNVNFETPAKTKNKSNFLKSAEIFKS